MKKVLKTAVIAFCMVTFTRAATVPVQNMSAWSLAAEYYGVVEGHVRLYDFAGEEASMGVHQLRLHYSPIPFLRFTAGIGGAHSYASPSVNGSDIGLAASGGFALYLPRLLNFLSLTVGYDAAYLNASEESYYSVYTADDDESLFRTPEKSGKTTALLHTPYIGAIFHIGRYFDLEAGAQYRHFTVDRSRTNYTIANDGTTTVVLTPVVTPPVTDAVSEQFRLYGTLTLHERESGAYLSGGASYAPIIRDADDGRGRLTRLSIWAQLGLIMRDPRASSKTSSEYSEAYIDLKIRQDEMAGALERDIERDIRRNRERGRDDHDFDEVEE